MTDFFTLYGNYVFPGFIILGGFLLGILFEKIVLVIVAKLTKKIKWESDNLIVKAFKGEIVITFFLLSVYTVEIVFNLPVLFKQVSEKAMVIIVIFMVTIFLSRVTAGIIKSYLTRHETVIVSTTLITNIVKIMILSTGVLIVLNYLNISIIPIITTLGVGGIAVALALQPTLSNLFSGFQLLVSKQLKPGDYIKLGSGDEGYVEDISWRHTVIRTLSANLVTIPNSKLADSIITNYFLPEKEISVTLDIGVSYQSDLAKVERVTIAIARSVMNEVKGGVPGFEPFIRYHTFGDSAILFSVILRAQTYTDQFIIKHEFVKRLHAGYGSEGIEIPYPIRTVISKREK